MDQNKVQFTNLPPDILLHIINECDVLNILSLSSTCKRLQQMTDEHQVWLHQARHLQIPIPPGAVPSKAELKDWVISRTRVDVLWIKRPPADLTLCSFEPETAFVDAHLIPGGEFVVLLYDNGDIGLNRIERSVVTGELTVREVAKYKVTNEDDYPDHWSGLLTETSYGCPVLVLVPSVGWGVSPNPSVFLIDPVSQVIQKKQTIHCDFEDGVGLSEILAVGDRMFFILEGFDEMVRIAIAAGPGPNSVMKHFNLPLPDVDYDVSDMGFFLVSEHGLIVTSQLGIQLYHIPEFGAVDENSRLVPVWDWLGDALECRGTLYKTASPYPALWLQGGRATHTLEFGVDESGFFPVVTNHHMTERRPDFFVGKHLELRGRKGMGIDVERRGEVVLNTGVLGRPDITRRLRAPIPGLNINDRPQRPRARDVVKHTDLDEVTGRIVIAVGSRRFCMGMSARGSRGGGPPDARRLYIGDLPI